MSAERPQWVNVGCGPWRAPAPWWNLDVHRGDGVDPDELVADYRRPLAEWPDGSAHRIYLGHVLEHMPWPDTPAFVDDLYRALAPGGTVMVVGPDLLRVIQRWKDNLDPEGWPLIESIMENPWDRAYGQDGYDVIYESVMWPQARHWWNCYEHRVVYLLRDLSAFGNATPHAIDSETALPDWPLVAHTRWQCAVSATKPTEA